VSHPPPGRRAVKVRAALILVVVFLAAPLGLEAQPTTRVRVIGVVSATSPEIAWVDVFRQGLRGLGYVEGRDIRIEQRFAAGRPERFPDLIAEMVHLKVDILVVASAPGALAAKRATTSIPIVFLGVGDPVAQGVVPSFARPGGNITGLSLAFGERFAGKWVELLREAVPGVSHVAAMLSSSNPANVTYRKEIQQSAKVLGVKLELFSVSDREQLDAVFKAIIASRATAVIVAAAPLFSVHLPQLVEFAARNRLPAMYSFREYVEAGGLMAYGPSLTDSWQRAAIYVDKILKGAKPADLPVEQPTKFELVINMKTAKALGLTIPPSLLLRADQVIE